MSLLWTEVSTRATTNASNDCRRKKRKLNSNLLQNERTQLCQEEVWLWKRKLKGEVVKQEKEINTLRSDNKMKDRNEEIEKKRKDTKRKRKRRKKKITKIIVENEKNINTSKAA